MRVMPRYPTAVLVLALLGTVPARAAFVTRHELTVTVDRAYRIDRMRGLLGWEPPTSYETGLRLTAAALAEAGA